MVSVTLVVAGLLGTGGLLIYWGNIMPQNPMNFEAGRRESHGNTCEAIDLNDQVRGTGLVNEVVHNGFPTVATQIVLRKMERKQGSKRSTVSDASAAGRVSHRGTPGGILVNEAARVHTVASSDLTAAKPSLSTATATNQRRRKKFGFKKRGTELAISKDPVSRLMPPQEPEDWENEIQEVTLTTLEQITFGVQPYGPEDAPQFPLQDLTLMQRDAVGLPVMANYSPSVHHPYPVKWSCHNIPAEPDQFADADE